MGKSGDAALQANTSCVGISDPPLQVTHNDKTIRTGSNCIHVIFLLLYIILCMCVCACGRMCVQKGVKVGVLMYFVD